MKIAIHNTNINGFFSKRWVEFCETNNINYKIVNCYSTNIASELVDCDGLMWHFSHAHPTDYQIAIKLVAALEAANKQVFPNLNSCWHFDDKVAQKYLLEAINAPLIKSYVFYSKNEANCWIDSTEFPKVFKLKGGASSANVELVQSKRKAKQLVRKAFGRGFRQFDRFNLFFDALRKYAIHKKDFKQLLLTFLKIFVKSEYEKVKGKEIGYVYFQEFIPDNKFDIRIIVIGAKAFGIKRIVRTNDFRASGSGIILYEKKELNEECVRIAFEISKRLKSNCLSYDFIFDGNGNPLIAEISYGFFQEGYDDCTGYWDIDINWHDGKFKPQYWMVEDLIESIKKASSHD